MRRKAVALLQEHRRGDGSIRVLDSEGMSVEQDEEYCAKVPLLEQLFSILPTEDVTKT